MVDCAVVVDAPRLLGQRVVLSGLSSRPELNGQRGVAQSFEGGRYEVALEGGGESVRVRLSNLSLELSGALAITDQVVTAADRGDEAAVLAWLDSGGRVNATCRVAGVSGVTALMLAAGSGHERVVELLIRRGAEIHLQNSAGTTSLMTAARQDRKSVV